MGWGIALAAVLLLAMFPLRVKFRYGADGFTVKACVGFITVWKSPSDKPKAGHKKDKRKKSSTNAGTEQKQPKKKSGGSVLDFLPLVRLTLELLSDFRKKLRVTRMDVNLVLSGEDPCDLAVNYGRVWAAVGNLIPVLERSLVMKKRNIRVGCDFTSEQTTVTADIIVAITLGRILHLLMKYGVQGTREYLNITKSRKGGTVS